MKASPAAPPLRRLAPLAMLVLAAHLAVLQRAPQALLQPGPDVVRSFSTRTVAAPPPPSAATTPGPVEPPPRPRRIRRESPQAPKAPTPAPAPAVVARAAQPPPAPVAPPVETRPPAAASDIDSGLPAAQPAPPAADPSTAGQPAAAGAPTTALPQVVALPVPVKLRYHVTASRYGMPLSGEAQLHWRHDGQQYEAQLEVRSSLFPSRVQRSTGRVTPEGLAPEYFSDKGRNEQATHFERDKGRITFSNNRPPAPLQAGMQDRLSVVVQLAVLIGGDPVRFPAGTQIAIPTASTREAETWIFSVEGEEDLQLPGGLVRAVRLQRKPRKEYDQKVELWLAPRMDYAPVRLRLTNPDGDTVDQRWSSTDKG